MKENANDANIIESFFFFSKIWSFFLPKKTCMGGFRGLFYICHLTNTYQSEATLLYVYKVFNWDTKPPFGSIYSNINVSTSHNVKECQQEKIVKSTHQEFKVRGLVRSVVSCSCKHSKQLNLGLPQPKTFLYIFNSGKRIVNHAVLFC